MKVKEALDKINSGHFHSLFEAEEEVLKNKSEKVACNIDIDGYRWFSVSTSIYKLEDGLIGVRGVSNLKSESMTYSDCDVTTEAEEYEETTITYYKPKNK